jgi:hypothetical protein
MFEKLQRWYASVNVHAQHIGQIAAAVIVGLIAAHFIRLFLGF